eukprot:CAMPEP_0176087716 /NCGR_PEP_ID=MMETSP0120_2-20121206/43916_1 /TAXON_ID=160619 /ORGANISM="Kryptoperidinium foliaceum, Strain CCMP 1326" /LENGTH=212 /DNA_ID=CAMNT_0017421565 /DNA_START=29 /DNA_END=665 /DNA_ORIENTATION=+
MQGSRCPGRLPPPHPAAASGEEMLAGATPITSIDGSAAGRREDSPFASRARRSCPSAPPLPRGVRLKSVLVLSPDDAHAQHLLLFALLDHFEDVAADSVHLNNAIAFADLLVGMLVVPRLHQAVTDGADEQRLAILVVDVHAQSVAGRPVDGGMEQLRRPGLRAGGPRGEVRGEAGAVDAEATLWMSSASCFSKSCLVQHAVFPIALDGQPR